MTEPTAHDATGRRGTDRPDETRDISDVGLPHPGDDAAPDVTARPDAAADEAALDEVFPAEDR